jgi:hypothetical protein
MSMVGFIYDGCEVRRLPGIGSAARAAILLAFQSRSRSAEKQTGQKISARSARSKLSIETSLINSF